MTRKQAETILDGTLSPLMCSFGFSSIDSLRYEKAENDGTAYIAFPYRISGQGVVYFSAILGVGFERFARLLDTPSTQPLFVQPIHLFHGDRKMMEWELRSGGESADLIEGISAEIATYAIPFWSRYTNLNELRKAIESSDARVWRNLGIDVDRRVLISALFQFIDGKTDCAVKSLDVALDERKNERPMRRFDIAQLRNRLANSV